ncbi:MAG: UDP-N-acetylmuramoyl-L-alanyl-D-glutamate--2,6-diaminopimelate ligase [Phenylobacterium sp.]|nr:UDP-N-acetylmuramoyl-L-alanyl-D-glutamate--2,6-diaminopimelate ligase [Phenylobacterium sp.]MDP1873255.1 UDP-N-acetylmuramoyl-L-alanyl-D-glutamate--2,6-diaminopimelate ligase [Phenylobacterium sp.]
MPRLSSLLFQDLDQDPEITGVTADSRKVQPGFLFAALPGVQANGAAYAEQAVRAGAAAVIAGEALGTLDAPVVTVADPRRAYALAAAAFWGTQPPVCVAVTGTNGKTSVATFCRQIFASAGRRAASMGTLGVLASGPDLNEQLTPPGLTTPDAGDMAELMARLAELGVTHLALEASSHGIDQRRLDGVKLKAAGFLNLTQDHLDYHGDMDAYRAAKLRLFEALLPRGGTAVLNADSDAFAPFAAAAIQAGHAILSVGEAGQSLRLNRRELTPDGQRMSLSHDGRTFDLRLPLAGAFQAANALAAAGLCLAAGESIETVLAALERLEGAPGRMQRIGSGPRGGEAYVDYAHTPDGLKTALSALRPHTRGRLIVVFGAGGDRDPTKRSLMGEAAAEHADIAIVTDDNPRSEDPAQIRAQVRAGAPEAQDIGDRRAAIAAAVALMREGDVLVVAGKGHEQTQTIAGAAHHFDDVAVTAQALEAVHV